MNLSIKIIITAIFLIKTLGLPVEALAIGYDVRQANLETRVEEVCKASKTLEDGLNKKLYDLNSSLERFGEKVESAKHVSDVQLQVITAISSAVIALVAICLGLGVYKIYIDHKRLVEDAEELTRQTFEKWRVNREEKLHDEYEKMVKRQGHELQTYSYFIMLRDLLKRGEPNSEEIFPLITPLVQDPKKIYKPLFGKLLAMNVSPEVTAKVREGLQKLS